MGSLTNGATSNDPEAGGSFRQIEDGAIVEVRYIGQARDWGSFGSPSGRNHCRREGQRFPVDLDRVTAGEGPPTLSCRHTPLSLPVLARTTERATLGTPPIPRPPTFYAQMPT